MPPTGELARIDDELRRAYDGDAWRGPPPREVLNGVPTEAAAGKHPQLTRTAWALVNHPAADTDVVVRRITEWRAIGAPEAGDFLTETAEEAWTAALENLDRQHRTLLAVLAGLDVAQLDEIVPGKTYPVAVMLHGIAQHYTYHAGQIAPLKKLVG